MYTDKTLAKGYAHLILQGSQLTLAPTYSLRVVMVAPVIEAIAVHHMVLPNSIWRKVQL